ncbi:MAG: hypothetical protein LBF24_00315 [Puniceicoccales bacterium]|nr:hypothetical protein [Puniceicoccales bacterium]
MDGSCLLITRCRSVTRTHILHIHDSEEHIVKIVQHIPSMLISGENFLTAQQSLFSPESSVVDFIWLKLPLLEGRPGEEEAMNRTIFWDTRRCLDKVPQAVLVLKLFMEQHIKEIADEYHLDVEK